MKNPKSMVMSDRRGFSLVEVMVGMVILTITLLSLASSAALAARTTARAGQDLDLNAVVQWKVDSLGAAGYANVVSGSDTVDGHLIYWFIASSGNPKLIFVVYERLNLSTGLYVSDWFPYYIAKPIAQ